MKQLLRISRVFHASHRFKSKPVKDLDAARMVKKLNYENKLLFGKLVESSKDKTTRLACKGNAKPTVSDTQEPNSEVITDSNMCNSKLNEIFRTNKRVKTKYYKSIKTSGKDAIVKCNSKKPEIEAVAELLRNLPLSTIEESLRSVKPKKSRKNDGFVETAKENKIRKKEADICDPEYSNSFKACAEDLSHSTEKVFNNENYLPSPVSQSFNAKENLSNTAKKEDSFYDTATFPKSVSKEVTSEDTEIEHISDAHCSSTLFNVNKLEYFPCAIYEIDSTKLDKGLHCPTVSAILQESMSKMSEFNLNRWRENKIAEMGEEDFHVYSKAQMQFGSKLKKRILNHLRGKSDKKCSKDMEAYWASVLPTLPLFSELKETERVAVHSSLGYKGMVDSLVEFRNKLMLVSWKKSEQIVPSLDRTFDTPLQIAAYVGAINFDRSFPFAVEDALLVMSYGDGTKADIFHLNKEKLLHYWKLWLKRLKIYDKRLKEIDVPSSDVSIAVVSRNEKINLDEELAKIVSKEEKNMLSGIKPKPKDINIDVNCSTNNDEYLKKVNAEFKESKNDNKTMKMETFDNLIVKGEFASLIPENFETEITEQKVWRIESCLEFPLYNKEKNRLTTELKIELNPDHQYASCPAVTTILSETKSETAKFLLERWKNNLILQLGVEGFEEYQKNLLATGSSFHKLVQDYLLGVPEEKLQVLPELQGCWDSLKPVFPLISDVEVTEGKVIHETLNYKGIIDCVARFRDKLVIIDWKKSDKIKSTISMTYDGPVQIAAYIGALNFDKNYPFKVNEGLLVVSYVDGTKADIFQLDEKSCLKYWKLWLERLYKYRTNEIKNSLKIEY